MKDPSLEIEVYRFGVSAAPLSQYLFMLKKEVLSYSPDLIIYLFIHNNFEQSYTFPPGRITSSFMKFKFDDQNQISEIPPNTFKPSYRLLKKSRVFCFLWYQFQFDRIPYLKSIRTVFLQPEKETFFAKKPHSINNKNKLITEYFFDENIRLQKKHSFEFLVAMDAQRNSKQHSIYNKDSNIPDPLNLMVANVAAMKKILFIDLTKPFQTDYHLHGKKFEYRCDNHWNSYGHRVVYETLAPIVTRFKNKHLEK